MKLNLIPAFTICLTLGACMVSTGGAGQMKSGTPVIGEAVRDPNTRSTTYYVRSATGLDCYALLMDNTNLFPKPEMNRKTTLHCPKGRKGTALLSANQFKQRVTMIFVTPDGQEGVVEFGL